MSNSKFQIPHSALRTPHSAKVSGISAVPLIIALVLMITVGGFFISLMLGKHIGAPLLAQATKALYIAEAGIEYTAEYLKSYVDWTTVPDISSTTFGNGTFAVAFTYPTPISVIATSTGTFGNAERVISINFTKESVLGSGPVQLNINIGNYHPQGTPGPTIYCDNGYACNDPLANCSCPVDLEPPQALDPIVPANAPPMPWQDLTISADCAFPAGCGVALDPSGTYYFNRLIINQDEHVTVSGPVTIWISETFDLRQNATFNFLDPYGINDYDDPADVLLLSAADGTYFGVGNSAKFSGAIYAPNGTVDVDNSGVVVGSIVGDTVWLRNNSTVTYDSDAGSLTGGYSVTYVVKGSNWGEM